MAEQMAEPRTVVDDAHELISSRRVEGTPVYNRKDERLGAIHSVMIEKKSGKVAYAVLSFGGFLGMKEHVHPVPWEMLTYDVDMDAYLVRSEEHTSELQSLMRISYAVFCLKKKKKAHK